MTTDSRKIQLETGVDATGAKAGFQQVKEAAKDMAQGVTQAGQEAARGLDGVGTGAAASAQKVDRATSNLIGSIQRATAAQEAGKKSGADFFESLAKQRNVPADVLKPYLDQLREAEARTKALSASTADLSRLTTSLGASGFNQSLAGVTTSPGASNFKRSLDSLGTSLGATAFDQTAAATNTATAALKPYTQQVEAATTKTRALASASQELRLSTSLGATSFAKPLGNPSTSLGATAFGALPAAAEQAEKAASQSLQKIGVSAGQTRQALAQLPAQFSDIIVSLQGGQRPLSVFLQQGSQIKDSFGGAGPAVKAIGGYVLGLVSPFTIAAAAVAGLGYAYLQGEKESQEYNKALILTGNYLGLTVSQLQNYATEISKTVGTQGAAAEALSTLAASGKVAASSLTEVGTAVVLMNRVLGTSIDEATATFAKLADEPTKASVKLNDAMHYLNLATYERIRALEEQGNKEAAAALAQKALADATIDRLKTVESATGILSKGWRALTDEAKWAWDAMLGIGRTKSAGEALSDAQKRVSFLQQNGSTPQALAAAQGEIGSISRKALREQENAYSEGERTRNEAAKIGASDRLKTLSDEVKTNADKRKKAIQDLNNDFKTLGKPLTGAEYDKLVSNINDKFKDPKEAKGPAFTDDAATRTLQALRQQQASLKEQLTTDEKLTDAEKERAKFVQLIADLKTKGTLTADQKSLLAAKDSILAAHDANVEISKQVEAKKEAARLDKEAADKAKELARTFAGINLSLESANQGRRDQNERVLGTIGLGDRARQEVDAEQGIRAEARRAERQATKAAAEQGKLGSDEYKDEVAKIKASLAEGLDDLRGFFAKEKAAREDWRTGANAAFANYIDQIEDVAGRTKSLVTDSLNGFTDSVTGVLTGDKGSSLKDFGTKIYKQIAKGFVEQSITKPIATYLQDSMKDGDSFISKILGSLTGGKGSDLLGSLLGNKDASGGALGAAGTTAAATATSGLAAAATSAAAALASLTAAAGGSSAASGAGLFGALGGSMGGGDAGGDALGAFIQLNGFAGGGDPPVGRVSLVGERGPELFVPKQAGTIVPNSMLGGGGGDIHNTFVLSEPASRATQAQVAQKASDAIRRAQRNK